METRLSPRWARLPWVDGGAALVVGVLALLLHVPLARLYGLSEAVVVGVALANLGYAAVGLTLAVRRPRAEGHLHLLIAANLLWAFVCVGLVSHYAGEATVFGLGHSWPRGCLWRPWRRWSGGTAQPSSGPCEGRCDAAHPERARPVNHPSQPARSAPRTVAARYSNALPVSPF